MYCVFEDSQLHSKIHYDLSEAFTKAASIITSRPGVKTVEVKQLLSYNSGVITWGNTFLRLDHRGFESTHKTTAITV
jgi:hypothetical protein